MRQDESIYALIALRATGAWLGDKVAGAKVGMAALGLRVSYSGWVGRRKCPERILQRLVSG